MAKTTKEMIEVMEWFDKGEVIEFSEDGFKTILGEANKKDDSDLGWNWEDFDYRIKQLKQKVTIEKWLIEDNNIKVVVETSGIDSWLKSFPTAQKLKLIESYEVEI